ncbi:MAG: hypothetical protein ACOCYW_04735 [Roseicyclus sp.]
MPGAGSDAAAVGMSGDRYAGRPRFGRMRLRQASRDADAEVSEARIEMLGDRIELLEFTLNEYIDKIDAVATHATRISVDRLMPVVEKLSRAVREGRGVLDDAKPAPAESGPGAVAAATGGPDASAIQGELAAVSARLANMETRIAALPDRIRIAAAAPLPSEGEARTRANVFAALSALGRRQEGLQSHLDARLDAIEALSAPAEMKAISERLSRCEDELARIPDTVRTAAAATLPDPSPIAGAVDALRATMAAMARNQAEAQTALLERLAALETRLALTPDAGIAARLDAMSDRLASLPDRITVAAAPPAIRETDEQRGAAARAVAALTALGRQQERLAATLGQRLEALEHRVTEGRDMLPEAAVAAIAAQLKARMRDVTARGSTADASALMRATQHRDRKTSVALARIERALTALASRDTGQPGALEDLTARQEDRTARILEAIANLRAEMAEGLAAAAVPPDGGSQAAVQAALAELLAVAQRDSRKDA